MSFKRIYNNVVNIKAGGIYNERRLDQYLRRIELALALLWRNGKNNTKGWAISNEEEWAAYTLLLSERAKYAGSKLRPHIPAFPRGAEIAEAACAKSL